MSSGLLIVFEGSEGAGKTTQVRMLAERLHGEGIEVVSLREPGGTPLGDAIRSILLDPGQDISPTSEALLFMASRAEIVRQRIDPALARGVVVLMDRFFLSTYAYQMFGRGLPESEIRTVNAFAVGARVPDLTLVLEVPVSEGMERATARGAHDRMEQSGEEFHNRVESAFASFTDRDWQLAHPECGVIAGVDGRGTAGEVHERVLDTLARKLPERFSMLSKVRAS